MMSKGTLITTLCVLATATPGARAQLTACPWDCGDPTDEQVGIVDFLTLLAQWGSPGACDFDGDSVGITDFLKLLAHWGPCPPPANDQCAGAILIDRLDVDGLIDQPFDLTAATPDPEDSACLGEPNTHRDIWYCLSNGTGSDKHITLTTTVDLTIEVTDGCTCPPGPLVVCGFGDLGDAMLDLAPGASVTIRLIDSLDLPHDGLRGSLQILNEPAVPTGACCLSDGTCTDGLSEDCAAQGGFYQGDGTDCASADCFPCPDPAKIDENEPDCGLPVDTVNGGCNLDPPLFTSIACGDEICGTSGAAAQRDTDWYAIQLSVPGRITWQVTPEFPALIGLLEYSTAFTGSGDCQDLTGFLSPAANVDSGQTGSVTTQCLPAGTFYLFVAPQKGEVVECGAQYNAQATCQGGCTGACCFVANCSPTVTEELCVFFGGAFQGEGTSCSPQCGNPQAGSCCLAGCTTGCSDADCCQAVCAVDPFCCAVAWDATCASETVFFPAQCGCP